MDRTSIGDKPQQYIVSVIKLCNCIAFSGSARLELEVVVKRMDGWKSFDIANAVAELVAVWKCEVGRVLWSYVYVMEIKGP